MGVDELPMTAFPPGATLRFRDGRTVRHVGSGVDDGGEYLRLAHTAPAGARLAGPHWHPLLVEEFTVTSGELIFVIDGDEQRVSGGHAVTVAPRQVHRFRTATAAAEFEHVIRPPGRHREMFAFWHHLDTHGLVRNGGVPRRLPDIARLWVLQDGYLAGIPPFLQRATLGRLARL